MQQLPQPNDHFAWVQAAAGPALVCRPLSAIAAHLFTTRGWPLGSRTSFTPGARTPRTRFAGTPAPRSAADDDLDAAWEDVARALSVDADHLVRVHQVHGAAVVIARAATRDRPDVDIIIAHRSGLALAVQAADCVPLLVADRRTGAVAAAHAGWRGLAAKVPGAAVAALAREFDSRASDLVAAIGPSIGVCCYEVSSDVRDRFRGSFPGGEWTAWFRDASRPDYWFFNTWTSTRAQLETAGVSADQIFVAELCTASHPEVFCSYRRNGSPAGRIAGAIRVGAELR